jgi:hypothetical protein
MQSKNAKNKIIFYNSESKQEKVSIAKQNVSTVEYPTNSSTLINITVFNLHSTKRYPENIKFSLSLSCILIIII